jgi:hypothetical protein
MHVAIASVEMLPTGEGGLKSSFPSGTRSLLVSFDEAEDGETFGAVIEVEHEDELAPGTSATVRLSFWSDAARIYGSYGATLSLEYGREVGRGTINEVLE